MNLKAAKEVLSKARDASDKLPNTDFLTKECIQYIIRAIDEVIWQLED